MHTHLGPAQKHQGSSHLLCIVTPLSSTPVPGPFMPLSPTSALFFLSELDQEQRRKMLFSVSFSDLSEGWPAGRCPFWNWLGLLPPPARGKPVGGNIGDQENLVVLPEDLRTRYHLLPCFFLFKMGQRPSWEKFALDKSPSSFLDRTALPSSQGWW